MSQTGRSIPVVRTIRVRKDRVRFPAARPEGHHPNGLSYSGSTHGGGSSSPSSILGSPTERSEGGPLGQDKYAIIFDTWSTRFSAWAPTTDSQIKYRSVWGCLSGRLNAAHSATTK